MSPVPGKDVPAPGRNGAPARPPDWERLRAAAREVTGRAYAPYSGLAVGAAGLTTKGRVMAACNVENASLGLTLCAECGLVAMVRAAGCTGLTAVSVIAGDGRPLAPCGRCRQVLLEHGGGGLLIDAGPDAAPVRLDELLPDAFDAAELEQRRTSGAGGEPPRPGPQAGK
jgi:cytidine deaminase